jgi:hypothetical protein
MCARQASVMSQPMKPAVAAVETADRGRALLLAAVAWLVPGGGHFMLGRNRKAVTFFVVLTFMYLFGLAAGGRLFPMQVSEPLVFLAALAEWAVGLPRAAAAVGGFGQGDVVAVSYEYGNTFVIVAGLLNALVVLDTYDLAVGRKAR